MYHDGADNHKPYHNSESAHHPDYLFIFRFVVCNLLQKFQADVQIKYSAYTYRPEEPDKQGISKTFDLMNEEMKTENHW